MARGGGYLSMAPLCKGSWQPVGLTEGLTVVGSRQSLRHRLWRRHLPLHKGSFWSGADLKKFSPTLLTRLCLLYILYIHRKQTR